MSRVYLDHAASTPMVPAAVDAMTAELTRSGNASSLHASGRAARRVVEESRELIAGCVGARPAEVIFTSGATEADNLALKGAFWATAASGRRSVVSSAVEHPAVLESLDGGTYTLGVHYDPALGNGGDDDRGRSTERTLVAVDKDDELASALVASPALDDTRDRTEVDLVQTAVLPTVDGATTISLGFGRTRQDAARTARICSRSRSPVTDGSGLGSLAPAFGPRMPSPPAAETAATRRASVAQFIGAWTIGQAIPSVPQSGVSMRHAFAVFGALRSMR